MSQWNLASTFGIGTDTTDGPRKRTEDSMRRARFRRASEGIRRILGAPDLRAEPLTDAERDLVEAVGADVLALLDEGRPFEAWRSVSDATINLPGPGGGMSPSMIAVRRRMMDVLAPAAGIPGMLRTSSVR